MRVASLPSNIQTLDHTFVKRISYNAGYYVDTTYEGGQLTSWAYCTATKERIGSPMFAHTVRDKYKLLFLHSNYGRAGRDIIAWKTGVFRTFKVGDVIDHKDQLFEPASLEEWVSWKKRMYKNSAFTVLETKLRVDPFVGKAFYLDKPHSFGRGTYTVAETDLIPLAKRYIK